jgi:hypothetical protein
MANMDYNKNNIYRYAAERETLGGIGGEQGCLEKRL